MRFHSDRLIGVLKWLLVPALLLPVMWVWYAAACPSGLRGIETLVRAAPVSVRVDSQLSGSPPGYIADLSKSTEQDIESLLDRVEALSSHLDSATDRPVICLVLNGPEVEYFALKNYAKYQTIVDRIARLNASGVLDISISRKGMQTLGIGSDEVPAFLSQVPDGSNEIQRLLNSGFVYM